MRADPTILPLVLTGVGYDAPDGRPLLQGIDFSLTGGGVTVVLGYNGAGKSLMLRLCHGLILPSRGTIAWQGPGVGAVTRVQENRSAPRHALVLQEWVDGRRSAPKHTMVFQRPVMLRRTALGNLVHAADAAGLRGRARRERGQAALARFGLEHLADRPARALSGGEQQRLALARAWVLDPEVMFLDEPTANLDPAATKAVETMIQGFAADGITIMMTTHDVGQARRLADRVVFLHGGRLLDHADAATFFSRAHEGPAGSYLRGELAVG